jgi:WD40 repeat protein
LRFVGSLILVAMNLFAARITTVGSAVSLVVIAATLGIVLRGAVASRPLRDPGSASGAIAATRPQSVPVDHFGDPLPKYARARVGTVRFNEGGVFPRRAVYAPDGKSLISVGSNQGLRVWDAGSGRIVRSIGEPGALFRDIALSANGPALATIEEHSRLRLWDLASGRERRRWREPREGAYIRLAFSPDGRILAVDVLRSDKDATKSEVAIDLWETSAPTERRRRIEGIQSDLCDFKFSPDGKALATASHNQSENDGAKHEPGLIQLWDVASSKVLRRFPVESFGARSVAFSRDGRWLFAGITDRTIRVYDLSTGREILPRYGQDHAVAPLPRGGAVADSSGTINCLELSPDGSILASASFATAAAGLGSLARIHLWDVTRGSEIRQIPAHGQWIMSLSFAPDGRTIASTGAEPVIRLWDVATGREASPQAGHRSGIQQLVISPADGTVITGGYDGTIRQWDHVTGRELGLIADLPYQISGLAISPDGRSLLVGEGGGGKLVLWGVSDQREIRVFPRVPVAKHNYVKFGAFSEDGTIVAAELRVWDVASGRILATFRDQGFANDFSASSIPIFPASDGQRVITVEEEGIRIWDIASGKEARWAVQSKIHNRAVDRSPDGRLVATGGVVVRDEAGKAVQFDPAIRLWELASGQEVARLEGHEESTHDLAFSPDGAYLASCSGGLQSTKDRTIRVWDLAAGRELWRFEGHRGAVSVVAFTRDGRSVVSGSEDATALVWDVADLKDRSEPVTPLAPEALLACWNELASNDARAAYRATRVLSVPSAVPFLRDHLRPASVADPVHDVAIRSPEVLRTLRAIASLERVNTPEARRVIGLLADGNTDALVTREAKSTRDRLSRKMRR